MQSTLYCSWCGKSQYEVRKLIAGPVVFICDECVEICNDILRDDKIAPLEEPRFDRDHVTAARNLRDSLAAVDVAIAGGSKEQLKGSVSKLALQLIEYRRAASHLVGSQLAVTGLKLKMVFHKPSGRWFISTNEYPHGPCLRFPSGDRITALWKEHAPGHGELFMGSLLSGPVAGFYVEIGGGSTPKERKKFLEALLAECFMA